MSDALRDPATVRLRATKRWLRALLVSSLQVGLLALCADQAQAADASGPGVSAIRAKRDSLSSELRHANFETPITENPQWTPDGGVFQFFTGSADIGAIYWSKYTGAHVVYGDILAYWANAGYETELGYPSDDEGGAASTCPDGTRRSQQFISTHVVNDQGVLDVGINELCWDGTQVVEGIRYLS